MTHLTPSQTDQLTHGFVTDSYNVSLMNFDRVFDVQNEKILGINAFQRGLSLQSALGDRGPQVPRSVSSKLAWLMLNIRMMGLDIFYAFQNSGVNSEGTSDLNKPGNLPPSIRCASPSYALLPLHSVFCMSVSSFHSILSFVSAYPISPPPPPSHPSLPP